jgi:lysophospholipase L1-like esterase
MLLALIFAAQCLSSAGHDTWLTYGDSKTANDALNGWGLQARIQSLARASGSVVVPQTIARAGYTVASMQALVDADLAAVGYTPKHILVNLGANDVTAMPVEADYKTNLAYILDAFHAKWPSARVWVMQPWRRTFDANSDTLATWNAAVLADGRSAWAHAGPNERVFLKGADNGVTYTTDGCHPNAAGYTLTAEQWLSALGN